MKLNGSLMKLSFVSPTWFKNVSLVFTEFPDFEIFIRHQKSYFPMSVVPTKRCLNFQNIILPPYNVMSPPHLSKTPLTIIKQFAPGVFLCTTQDDPLRFVLKGPIKANEQKFMETVWTEGKRITNHELVPPPAFFSNPELISLQTVPNTGITKPPYTYLITHYFPEGDLFDWITDRKTMSIEHQLLFVGQMLRILVTLTDLDLLHLDISLENFLVTDDQRLLLIDAGFSLPRTEFHNKYRYSGKPDYFDPSLQFKTGSLPLDYDPASLDSYALGVTILNFVTMDGYLQHIDNRMFLWNYGVIKFMNAINIPLHPIITQLLEGLLEPKYNQRITVPNAARIFFRSIQRDVTFQTQKLKQLTVETLSQLE